MCHSGRGGDEREVLSALRESHLSSEGVEMAACDIRGLMGRVKRVEMESPGADCRASVFPFHHSLSGPLALWSNYQEVNSFIQSWRSSEHELGVL